MKRLSPRHPDLVSAVASWVLVTFVTVPAICFWIAVGVFKEIERERLELLLPIVVLGAALLVSYVGGFVWGNFHVGRSFCAFGLLVLMVVMCANVLERPAPSLDYLWFGFGRRVLASSVLVGGIWWAGSRFAKFDGRIGRLLRPIVSTCIATIYLPAFLQPPRGIINLGDASHQVMEEISGPLVGHFPGINFVSTYTTLLGIPLLIIRPFSLSHAIEMNVVIAWVNILVLATPLFLVAIGRRVGAFRSWMVGLLFVVPPMMVSGKWGAAASNVESLSMVPGRTLLPVVLGYVIVRLLPRHEFGIFVGVGAVAVLVGFNNVEFGVPALASASFCVALIIRESQYRLMKAALFLSGVLSATAVLVVGSLLVKGRYDFWFRIGSYAGKPYSPAEMFPVWSTLNLLLGLYATSIVLGVLTIKKVRVPSVCGIYFGIWGLAAFPYCSYRCLGGMYMATQVYFIPAIGAALGIVGCLRSYIKQTDDSARIRVPAFVAVLGCFAIGCAIQAPNPRDEWTRVLGRVESAPWAEDSRRGLPSEWSTSRIDWLEVQPILDARDQIDDDSVGYFGYMGNSVQLATGLNNLSRINSSEVLQIKGTKKLVELACREVDEVRPRYVILVGMDLPCQGYRVADQLLTTKGVQVLMRVDR